MGASNKSWVLIEPLAHQARKEHLLAWESVGIGLKGKQRLETNRQHCRTRKGTGTGGIQMMVNFREVGSTPRQSGFANHC